jgi:hypothetical protein
MDQIADGARRERHRVPAVSVAMLARSGEKVVPPRDDDVEVPGDE